MEINNDYVKKIAQGLNAKTPKDITDAQGKALINFRGDQAPQPYSKDEFLNALTIFDNAPDDKTKDKAKEALFNVLNFDTTGESKERLDEAEIELAMTLFDDDSNGEISFGELYGLEIGNVNELTPSKYQAVIDSLKDGEIDSKELFNLINSFGESDAEFVSAIKEHYVSSEVLEAYESSMEEVRSYLKVGYQISESDTGLKPESNSKKGFELLNDGEYVKDENGAYIIDSSGRPLKEGVLPTHDIISHMYTVYGKTASWDQTNAFLMANAEKLGIFPENGETLLECVKGLSRDEIKQLAKKCVGETFYYPDFSATVATQEEIDRSQQAQTAVSQQQYETVEGYPELNLAHEKVKFEQTPSGIDGNGHPLYKAQMNAVSIYGHMNLVYPEVNREEAIAAFVYANPDKFFPGETEVTFEMAQKISINDVSKAMSKHCHEVFNYPDLSKIVSTSAESALTPQEAVDPLVNRDPELSNAQVYDAFMARLELCDSTASSAIKNAVNDAGIDEISVNGDIVEIKTPNGVVKYDPNTNSVLNSTERGLTYTDSTSTVNFTIKDGIYCYSPDVARGIMLANEHGTDEQQADESQEGQQPAQVALTSAQARNIINMQYPELSFEQLEGSGLLSSEPAAEIDQLQLLQDTVVVNSENARMVLNAGDGSFVQMDENTILYRDGSGEEKTYEQGENGAINVDNPQAARMILETLYPKIITDNLPQEFQLSINGDILEASSDGQVYSCRENKFELVKEFSPKVPEETMASEDEAVQQEAIKTDIYNKLAELTEYSQDELSTYVDAIALFAGNSEYELVKNEDDTLSCKIGGTVLTYAYNNEQGSVLTVKTDGAGKIAKYISDKVGIEPLINQDFAEALFNCANGEFSFDETSSFPVFKIGELEFSDSDIEYLNTKFENGTISECRIENGKFVATIGQCEYEYTGNSFVVIKPQESDSNEQGLTFTAEEDETIVPDIPAEAPDKRNLAGLRNSTNARGNISSVLEREDFASLTPEQKEVLKNAVLLVSSDGTVNEVTVSENCFEIRIGETIVKMEEGICTVTDENGKQYECQNGALKEITQQEDVLDSVEAPEITEENIKEFLDASDSTQFVAETINSDVLKYAIQEFMSDFSIDKLDIDNAEIKNFTITKNSNYPSISFDVSGIKVRIFGEGKSVSFELPSSIEPNDETHDCVNKFAKCFGLEIGSNGLVGKKKAILYYYNDDPKIILE